jgi:hypothetical protein
MADRNRYRGAAVSNLVVNTGLRTSGVLFFGSLNFKLVVRFIVFSILLYINHGPNPELQTVEGVD